MVGPCCGNPKLKWTESKTKSEGQVEQNKKYRDERRG